MHSFAFTRFDGAAKPHGVRVAEPWESFCQRFASPAICAEKLNLPGYSLATFANDHRAKANVATVTALALDYDAGTTSIDDAITLWSRYAGFLHTTWSHSVDRPRFRVLLRISRRITAEEHELILPWVFAQATKAGHAIDAKAKDPSRFWFAAGVAHADAPYSFRALAGTTLEVDIALAAVRAEQNEQKKRRQPKPSPAPRTTPAERKDKYTEAALRKAIDAIAGAPEGARNNVLNKEAFSLAGLVASGELDEGRVREALLDAADVAGLKAAEAHKTIESGLRQGSKKPRQVPESKRHEPEWSAPEATPAPSINEALDDAARVETAPTEPDWSEALVRGRHGQVLCTLGNLATIFRSDPVYAGRLRFDEMRDAVTLDDVPVVDVSRVRIREDLERRLRLVVADDLLWDALLLVARERSFHPVRSYLEALAWDGTPRLDRVLEEILGRMSDHEMTPEQAEELDLHRCMVRAWFISAVARGLKPGEKVDTVLVLVGLQGLLKSTFFAVLTNPWFSDTAIDLESKDAYLQIARYWCIEWAEVEHVTSKRQAGAIKAFVSKRFDAYRPPYARSMIEVPRGCVFVGSTNETQFLEDDTGSRRFFCVRVGGHVDVAKLSEWRDQLWAEAVHHYRGGEQWWLDAQTDRTREMHAEMHAVEDPWASSVLRWIAKQARTDHTSEEVLSDALGVSKKDQNKAAAMRIAKILRAHGWMRRKARVSRDGKLTDPVWAWFPPDKTIVAEGGLNATDA